MTATTKISEIFKKTECLTPQEILKYRQGNLSPNELRRIENHLAQCEFCSEAVEDIEEFSVESIERDFADLKAKAKKFNKPKLAQIFYYAVAVMLIGFSFLLGYLSGSENERIFYKYFSPYPDIVVHERGELKKDLLLTALNFYRLENFDEANKLFDKLLAKTKNDTALFYNGISLLALDEPEKALENFKLLITNGNNKFLKEALWYAGLAYLLEGKIMEAKKLFDLIKNDPEYSRKIKSITLELNINDK